MVDQLIYQREYGCAYRRWQRHNNARSSMAYHIISDIFGGISREKKQKAKQKHGGIAHSAKKRNNNIDAAYIVIRRSSSAKSISALARVSKAAGMARRNIVKGSSIVVFYRISAWRKYQWQASANITRMAAALIAVIKYQ